MALALSAPNLEHQLLALSAKAYVSRKEPCTHYVEHQGSFSSLRVFFHELLNISLSFSRMGYVILGQQICSAFSHRAEGRDTETTTELPYSFLISVTEHARHQEPLGLAAHTHEAHTTSSDPESDRKGQRKASNDVRLLFMQSFGRYVSFVVLL